MSAPELLACPLCSHPPASILRPRLVRGVRKGRWFIVTAFGCPHMDTMRADNDGDAPEPLAAWWDAWAATEAAKRCAAAGMDFDQAARFLDGLRPFQYAPAVVRR